MGVRVSGAADRVHGSGPPALDASRQVQVLGALPPEPGPWVEFHLDLSGAGDGDQVALEHRSAYLCRQRKRFAAFDHGARCEPPAASDQRGVLVVAAPDEGVGVIAYRQSPPIKVEKTASECLLGKHIHEISPWG